MIDPTLLTCAHRRCRHLTASGNCGLLIAGRQVLLNARGQCEMMEERGPDANDDAPAGSRCGNHLCGNVAMSVCAICGRLLCAHHRHWVPNGGIGSAGELLQAPYCDVCTLRFVRQNTGAELELPGDILRRDDIEDSDEWQPV